MLEKLQTSPSKKKLLVITLVSLAVFIVLTIIFRFYETALNPDGTGYGIIEFEFAFDQATATTMLSTWGSAGRAIALESVYLDFIYIAAYGIGLFCLTIHLMRALKDRWHNIGLIFGIAALLAGIFDIIENINLMIILNEPSTFPASAPLIAGVCAGIKFSLLFASIGFIAFGAIALLLRKLRTTTSTD